MKVLEEELRVGAESDCLSRPLFEGGPRASGARTAELRVSSRAWRQLEEAARGGWWRLLGYGGSCLSLS